MTDTASAPAQPVVPAGIKGWLILPAIGTFLSPVYLTISFFNLLPTLEKVWVGRAALSTGLLAFIAIESLCNVVFIFGWIAAIFLLIAKSPHYPKAYIALMAGMVIFLALDMLVSAGPYNHPPEQQDVIALVRTAIAAAIWCPYMLVSQRVKNTFVPKA